MKQLSAIYCAHSTETVYLINYELVEVNKMKHFRNSIVIFHEG